MRDVGRAAFPIFCFLLVEGFLHTHNRFKYGRNLLIFACISEIPWNFAQNGTLLYPDKQNVFFTLFLGYLAFCLVERFEKNASMQLVCMLLLLAVSYFLKADYGYKGFVFLLIMYWLHQHKSAQAVIGSCWLIYEWKACFAFIPLNMYNEKRGFIQGKWVKYLFYAFYPVHIAILTVIALEKLNKRMNGLRNSYDIKIIYGHVQKRLDRIHFLPSHFIIIVQFFVTISSLFL